MSAENCKLITDAWLIIGLGNPGKKNQNTRHNVGYWIIDRLRNSDFVLESAVLEKTNVYMNSSGEQVKELVDRKQIPLDNLMVVHDDLDVPLGEFRMQKGRSSAGHKGIDSIIQSLGSQDFWRLRIGISRPPEGVEADDYVLGELSEGERVVLENLLPSINGSIAGWL